MFLLTDSVIIACLISSSEGWLNSISVHFRKISFLILSIASNTQIDSDLIKNDSNQYLNPADNL